MALREHAVELVAGRKGGKRRRREDEAGVNLVRPGTRSPPGG